MNVVDLRSDTVTRPTPPMREAIARAAVGDDVFGDDPSINRLQETVAALLGKEAALFVPSGTMANQIAVNLLTAPGDEVLIGWGAHVMCFEGGAAAALSGVQFQALGERAPILGVFAAADVAAAIQPDNPHHPATRLVCLENTHNRAGGRVYPQAAIRAIAEVARARGLALHLDGARLWNAHVASGVALPELAAPFDTVSVCLSKGLGAPVGSLLCGSRALMARALRRRKMLGGGMRQAGLLAAAGLYALEHHVARLKDDHEHARHLAEALARQPGVAVDPSRVETNIVMWDLTPDAPLDAPTFVERAARLGLLLHAAGPRRLRAVTHLDVDSAACARAAELAHEVLRAA
jgi:threonine aldolase